jgi:hypothetical protein
VLGIDDETNGPDDHDAKREPFDGDEVLRAYGTGRQRRVNERKQSESENDALAPGIEYLAIQQPAAAHARAPGRMSLGNSFHTFNSDIREDQ